MNLVSGILLVCLLGFIVPNETAACHKTFEGGEPRPHGPNDSCEPNGGDDGANDAPDPKNLARADYVDFGGAGGGIAADGVDTCTVDRGDHDAEYDYWAWQEALLSDAESMLDDGNNGAGCNSYAIRSDVSGGGRWFHMIPKGHDTTVIERWLVVDFSSPDDTSCPDLDGDGEDIFGLGTPIYDIGTEIPDLDNDECVDHLAVWLKADRVLKNKANFQQLEIIIRRRGDADRYWVPWGSIRHINPLYLRDPSDDESAPFYGRDCRVMSTRPAWNQPHHPDVQEAELYMSLSPSSEVLVGTYNLPLEVCVIRASD